MSFGKITVIFNEKRKTPYEVLDLSEVGKSTYLICQRPTSTSQNKDKIIEPEAFRIANIDVIMLTKAFRANIGYLIVKHHEENPLDEIIGKPDETGDITIMPEHNDMSWLPKRGR